MAQPNKKDNKKEVGSENADPAAAEPAKAEPAATEPIEIISDIDDYQKRIESEWESTKSSYQEKINHILEDFIEVTKSNLPQPQDNETMFSHAEKELDAIEKKAKNLTGKKSESPRIINIDWATPRPIRRYRGIFFLAASLLLAGGFYFYYSAVPQVSTLPYSHTACVVIEKGNIYIPDWFRRSLYVHKARRGLPIVSVETLPNDFLTGLAFGPSKVWSANGVTGEILEHGKSIDHPVLNRVTAPGKNPTGLFFDGTDLWSLNDDAKKIVRHMGKDIEEIREEFSLPAIPLSAFSMVGNRIWVLNKKSREISVFRLGEPVKLTGTYDLDSFLKWSTPTGIFVQGSHVWITTEDPPQLLKLSKRKILSAKLE